MEEKESERLKKNPWFWSLAFASVIFRLILIFFPNNLNLASRPEWPKATVEAVVDVALFRLYVSWISTYLSILGPLTVKRTSSIGSFWMGCSNTFVSVSCYSDSTGDSSIRLWSRCAPKETLAATEFCKFGDAQSSDSSFQDKELTNQPVQTIFFLMEIGCVFLLVGINVGTL
ncbi:uncharacterized protein LOC130765874 [Actinidia eriantha]|uniref:uncharacterized protein LOC130765874 n=1 Tax=Actinidia eriantha TaxID=165200 RepID=UPI002583E47F|nr:uncharacterized protein LOC130765874 [Actinidia eriantha]